MNIGRTWLSFAVTIPRVYIRKSTAEPERWWTHWVDILVTSYVHQGVRFGLEYGAQLVNLVCHCHQSSW